MTLEFSSDGFDLDALPASGTGSGGVDNDGVIYEVGGRATVEETATVAENNNKSNDDDNDNGGEVSPVMRSEELKAQGNEEFKNQNYLEACDMYTEAIEACPGQTGDEILAMRDEFEEQEREKLYERNRLKSEARRQEQQQQYKEEGAVKQNSGGSHPGESGSVHNGDDDNNNDTPQPPPTFKVTPPHPYAENLAIYHCNRAACKLHLCNYEDALKDSDIAVLLRPDWAKAYVRRSLAHEKLEKTDLALSDAKKALELDSTNATVKKTVARLQKMEDERLEKLKEETIGKLKDLGNSLLSNFGLSLDNFKAKQDPTTGSYSISFDQNKG